MSDSTAAATPETHTEPHLSPGQIQVLFIEIRALSERAHRAAILVADSTASLHTELDAAIASESVDKNFLEDLRDRLHAQSEVVLTAITAANLSARLTTDFKPQA